MTVITVLMVVPFVVAAGLKVYDMLEKRRYEKFFSDYADAYNARKVDDNE